MEDMIREAMAFVRKSYEEEYSGHDYFHVLRVYKMALYIAEKEHADTFVVGLAAILHDVDDIKLSPETHEKQENAVCFLEKHGMEKNSISDICKIIKDVSYLGNSSVVPATIEGKCVQDADRLDAMGAIGIARAFAYGGNHGRKIYDPAILPELNMTKEEYRTNKSTTINHFYEKLFRLGKYMNTDTAKKIAERREAYMRDFVSRFLKEWEGALL